MMVPFGSAFRSLVRIVVRWVVTCGTDLVRQDAKFVREGRVMHPSASLAPMSMVTSDTRARCARRNVTAAASCDPPGYEQRPPLIMVTVVSPGQPSLTRRRPGRLLRSAAEI